MMMKTLSIGLLAVTASAVGCGSNDDGGRSSAKLKEVEVTRNSGGTTTIQRFEGTYDGSRIREMVEYFNGTQNGSSKFTYGSGGLTQIDFTDKEGDRASEAFSFSGDKLMRDTYTVTGVMSRERMLKYDASGALKEMTTNTMPTGSSASTTLTKFDYDEENRLAKTTLVDGSDTETTELRYDLEGRLERATMYSGTTHLETYSFTYLADGRVDEVTDTHNGRYEVSYDSANRISDIRIFGADSSMTTVAYTYDSGSVTGMTYAPSLPMAGQFDLSGIAYTDVDLMHGSPGAIGDIPHASGSGGGGGGSGSGSGGGGSGSGSGGGSCGFTPQSACDTCLEANCCSQTMACLSGTDCDAFIQCYDACASGDTTCQQSCAEQHPQGYSDLQSLQSCAQASCSASCQ